LRTNRRQPGVRSIAPGCIALALPVVLVASNCDVSHQTVPTAADATPLQRLDREAHPFILLTAETIPAIRERSQREPAKTWTDQLRRRCDSAASITTDASIDERLQFARDSAMCYVLTGETALAERSAQALADLTLIQDDLNTNDGHHAFVSRVPLYCEAYDLLRSPSQTAKLTWRIDEARDAAIRTNIADMARWLRENRPFWYGFTRNNWAIRQYAALAIATMTIADGAGDARPEDVRAWFEYARSETRAALDTQVCDEGAFAEGCGYMNYAAENYLPMFFAMRNLLHDDWFAIPRYRTNFDWLTKIRTPAGHLPNVDDSPFAQFPTHYLTSVYDDAGRFEWDWRRAGSPVFDLCRAICWRDDTIPPTPSKEAASIALARAGVAVFRSSWDDGAIYLLLVGEHDQPRRAGFGHEHPDNTSFMIEAFGEPLAIDGGYIDFSNHTLVNRPENHNLVLIDGAGPPLVQVGNQPLLVDNDAFIEGANMDGDIPHCTVRTNYANTDVRRTILMPGLDHFVIVDSLRPGDAREHDFTWALHGNAGANTFENGAGGAFELSDAGARWTRPSGVTLQLWLASSAGRPAISERFDSDGQPYRNQLTGHGPDSIRRHATAQGVVRATDTVFVALLVPTRNSADLPVIEEISGDGAVGVRVSFPSNGRVETIRVTPGADNRARIVIRATMDNGATLYELETD